MSRVRETRKWPQTYTRFGVTGSVARITIFSGGEGRDLGKEGTCDVSFP